MIAPDKAPILEFDDECIPSRQRAMRFWKRGFETAKCWYHEEWDGSNIQLQLAAMIAQAIDDEMRELMRSIGVGI
jgi:hypothetical protein